MRALDMLGAKQLSELSTTEKVWGGLSAVSTIASVIHGYKRNGGSIGWAIGWGLLGGLFPIIVPGIAIAQGFGKPKVGG